MRARVNHKKNINKEKMTKKFWPEFKKRGFKVDVKNDGSYSAEYKNAVVRKTGSNRYQIVLSVNGKRKFNIIPADSFMKTISQIEGMVKYKLFK